ncbi:MAG: hypothetical protein DHS20C11_19460 [Lysobacteraceae bacterium]|nr:MAG: hypothetical protein DHS20C11_19460 [Xanthomonadaceae bacterium]
MRHFFSPIMAWLLLALGLVCSLPFALTWYQIDQSRTRLVDQVQRSHLLAAKTASERLEARLSNLGSLLETLGNFNQLYLDPGSTAAQELITSAVQAEPAVLAINLTLVQDDSEELVFRAQVAEFDPEMTTQLPSPLQLGLSLGRRDGRVIMVVARETARPNVWLTAYAEDRELASLLAPEELGNAAQIFLADTDQGKVLLGPPGVDALPPVLAELATQDLIRSGARQLEWPDIGMAVSAFSAIQGTSLTVISRQPLPQAESLSRELRGTAWRAFFAVSVIVLLILALAYLKIVKPIKHLIVEQRKLAGVSPNVSSGNEISALNDAFAAMKRHVTEREALSRVFVDRYQVLRRIGFGGMGSVYLGWDPKLHRYVALKTLNFETLDGAERAQALRRLREEAVVAASLAHRNLVGVFDIIESDAAVFVAMELVNGESLGGVLARRRRLPIRIVLPIAVAVLRGLAAAHDKGMVHRDIKPANVLLDKNGDIKIADFGTAAPVTLGTQLRATLSGTAGYVAPESIIGGQFSPKSDVFSVGVVIVECLTGVSPFRGKNMHQTMTRTTSVDVSFDEPYLRHIDPVLARVIGSLLDKDPERRPAADDALKALLGAWSKPVVWEDDWLDINSILDEKDSGARDEVIANSMVPTTSFS